MLWKLRWSTLALKANPSCFWGIFFRFLRDEHTGCVLGVANTVFALSGQNSSLYYCYRSLGPITALITTGVYIGIFSPKRLHLWVCFRFCCLLGLKQSIFIFTEYDFVESFFMTCFCQTMCVQSCLTFCSPMDCIRCKLSRQAPLPKEFS